MLDTSKYDCQVLTAFRHGLWHGAILCNLEILRQSLIHKLTNANNVVSKRFFSAQLECSLNLNLINKLAQNRTCIIQTMPTELSIDIILIKRRFNINKWYKQVVIMLVSSCFKFLFPPLGLSPICWGFFLVVSLRQASIVVLSEMH